MNAREKVLEFEEKNMEFEEEVLDFEEDVLKVEVYKIVESRKVALKVEMGEFEE